MQQIYVVVSLAETQQRRFLLFVTRLCFHDDVSVQHYHQCHFIFYHQRCRMVPRLFMVLFIIINLILIIIVVIIKCICIAQEAANVLGQQLLMEQKCLSCVSQHGHSDVWC